MLVHASTISDPRELDDIVLTHTSDKLTRNIFLNLFESSIQRIKFTLVMRDQIYSSQLLSNFRSLGSDKKPLENTFLRRHAKTSQTSPILGFTKKSSNLPRVVWAEKSKKGPRFGIGPSYYGVSSTSQCSSAQPIFQPTLD